MKAVVIGYDRKKGDKGSETREGNGREGEKEWRGKQVST
jgi:hypothetical protein